MMRNWTGRTETTKSPDDCPQCGEEDIVADEDGWNFYTDLIADFGCNNCYCQWDVEANGSTYETVIVASGIVGLR